MPKIYLVRWPDDRVSLVTAEDEGELFTTVANMGDNTQFTFEQYLGNNLCLTFSPKPSPCIKRSPLADVEAPETQEEVLRDLRSLYASRLFADVKLKVDDRTIPCHRAILSQRCKYFHAMFVSDMQESQQDIITLSGFSYTVVEAVIKFLYTGVLDIPNQIYTKQGAHSSTKPNTKDFKVNFLVQILEASDFYGLSSLHRLCVHELIQLSNIEPVTIETAVQLFNLGSKFSIDSLMDQGCFLLGKELSQKMLWGEELNKEYSELSIEIKDHLKLVWEEKLQQHPILSLKDQELIDCLTISSPPLGLLVDKVLELIEEGASPVNISALHILSQHWNGFDNAPMNKDLFEQLAVVFIKAGCDVNKLNHSDHSPLHIAVRQGRVDYVKTLLSLGADPHLKCSSHRHNALEEAVYGFDEEAAVLALTSTLISLVPVRLMAFKGAAYNTCLQICTILTEAMSNSSNSKPQHSDEPSIDINPFFIDRFFKGDELDTAAKIKFDTGGIVLHPHDLEATMFEFLYPTFAAELETLQQLSAGTTETKMRLSSALSSDLSHARHLRGSGKRLASLQRLKDDGRFREARADSWIHRYHITNMLQKT